MLLCKRAAHLATCGLTRAVKPLQGAQVAKRYQIEIESDLLLIDTYKNFKHRKIAQKIIFKCCERSEQCLSSTLFI